LGLMGDEGAARTSTTHNSHTTHLFSLEPSTC
jgi:hypothetical protein